MIHLILRAPIAYQKTLIRALSQHYNGAVTVWFHEPSDRDHSFDSGTNGDCQLRFLSQTGYRQLWRELRADREAIVVLGSWSSEIAYKTLKIVAGLRVPVFIWADHPHPRQRTWIKDRARKIYLRSLSRFVSGFLACGWPTAQHLEALGVNPQHITQFPYWVDVPSQWSLPGGSSIAGDPLRLAAIGRQVAVKQFEVAIKAVALTNAKSNRRSVELVLVGDGPERATLESTANDLRCADAVQFCGWLEGEELFRQIESADALVLTSSFDAYGVVVLEAMARGRPVFASDGVVAALDRDDGSGAIMTHPAGHAEFLAQQIEGLAHDRDRLRRASFAARAIAEQWTPDRAASILDGVLVKSKRGAALVRNRRGEAVASLEPAVIPDEASLVAGQ